MTQLNTDTSFEPGTLLKLKQRTGSWNPALVGFSPGVCSRHGNSTEFSQGMFLLDALHL